MAYPSPYPPPFPPSFPPMVAPRAAPQASKSGSKVIIIGAVVCLCILLIVCLSVWASNALCDKTNPESQTVGMNCAAVYESSGGSPAGASATATVVPAGMIEGKVVKIARTDSRVEHLGLLGIDIYDASGARITTGMTASLAPAVTAATATAWGSTTPEFSADYLIDGVHTATTTTTPSKLRLPFTGAAANAYMQVDLGSNKVISKIVIYVRADDVARIGGTTLTVTNAAGAAVLTIPLTGDKTVYTFSAPLTNSSTSSTYMPQPLTSAYVKESFSSY